MYPNAAVVLTALVLGYAVVSELVRRWYIAPADLRIARNDVRPLWIRRAARGGRDPALHRFWRRSLAVILFNQAAALDVFAALRRGRIALRLLVGIPLTIGLNTVLALVLLPALPVLEAVCLYDRPHPRRSP